MGDYKIDGNDILTPTTFRWMPRQILDVQGDNRPIYAGIRSAQLTWRLESYEDWSNIQGMYRLVEATGSHVVRIPAFPTATGSSWAFESYTGVHMAEPQTGPFFESYPTNVVLILGNIVTG